MAGTALSRVEALVLLARRRGEESVRFPPGIRCPGVGTHAAVQAMRNADLVIRAAHGDVVVERDDGGDAVARAPPSHFAVAWRGHRKWHGRSLATVTETLLFLSQLATDGVEEFAVVPCAPLRFLNDGGTAPVSVRDALRYGFLSHAALPGGGIDASYVFGAARAGGQAREFTGIHALPRETPDDAMFMAHLAASGPEAAINLAALVPGVERRLFLPKPFYARGVMQHPLTLPAFVGLAPGAVPPLARLSASERGARSEGREVFSINVERYTVFGFMRGRWHRRHADSEAECHRLLQEGAARICADAGGRLPLVVCIPRTEVAAGRSTASLRCTREELWCSGTQDGCTLPLRLLRDRSEAVDARDWGPSEVESMAAIVRDATDLDAFAAWFPSWCAAMNSG